MKNKSIVIKKIRIYPSFLYFLLEKWLKKMSLKGWHLVFRKFGIIYYFEKGVPEEKEYFVWDPTYTGEGKYSIASRYPFLEKTYGVEKKKSKLNKNSIEKYDNIIEIDTKKIDIHNDLAYKELKNDRNRLYIWRFIRNIAIVTIVLILTLLLLFLI